MSINSEKAIKILGVTATAMGMAATAISGWVSNKNMENTISKKVAEEVLKQMENMK